MKKNKKIELKSETQRYEWLQCLKAAASMGLNAQDTLEWADEFYIVFQNRAGL